MKKLASYLNSLLSKEKEEEVTKTLFENHFDKTLKEEWSKTLADEYQVYPSNKKTNKLFQLSWKVGAVAASILFIIFLGKIYQTFSQPELTLSQFVENQKAELHIINIRKGTDVESVRNKANNFYASKNFNEAIENYKLIVNSKEGIIDDYFYYGLSHFYLNQPGQAIPLFQKSMTLDPSNNIRDTEQIQWYLCLAFIENEQLDLARKELGKLNSTEISPKLKVKVNKILDLIEK